jgi:hypothetical protein
MQRSTSMILNGGSVRRYRQFAAITSAPAAQLGAVLDERMNFIVGAPLPPLSHWVYFPPCLRSAGLGTDGHPQRGGLLPPVLLPRRMWAEGRLRFVRALHVGDEAMRESEAVKVSLKSELAEFTFVVCPRFANEPLRLRGRRERGEAALWAEEPGDRLAMTAHARFDESNRSTNTKHEEAVQKQRRGQR